jgi:hypothetical protein
MTSTFVPRPGSFLRDTGLLFEINRQVLHPLGLELLMECDEAGEVDRIRILDNRAADAPLVFTPEAFEEGRHRYQGYLADRGRRNLQKRRQIGMVVQTGPNLPPSLQRGATAADEVVGEEESSDA